MTEATTRGNVVERRILDALRGSGFHRYFKGQHVQVEVAQWYRKQGKQVELNGTGKTCDLVLDRTWLVDVCSATCGKDGRYFFNNRHKGTPDYFVFVPVDQSRLPMFIMSPTLKQVESKGFRLWPHMHSEQYEIKFLGYLR